MAGKSTEEEFAQGLLEVKAMAPINVPLTPFMIWFIISHLQLVLDYQFVKDRKILVTRVCEAGKYLQGFVNWPEAVKTRLEQGWSG